MPEEKEKKNLYYFAESSKEVKEGFHEEHYNFFEEELKNLDLSIGKPAYKGREYFNTKENILSKFVAQAKYAGFSAEEIEAGGRNIVKQLKGSTHYFDHDMDYTKRREQAEINTRENHPELYYEVFGKLGEELTSTPAITKDYNKVITTIVPKGDEEFLKNYIDKIEKGSDVAFGFHSGLTFSKISNDKIGSWLKEAEPDTIYAMTCHGEHCADDFSQAGTVLYRPNALYQGVYQDSKTKLQGFFSRYNGRISSLKEGTHYETHNTGDSSVYPNIDDSPDPVILAEEREEEYR